MDSVCLIFFNTFFHANSGTTNNQRTGLYPIKAHSVVIRTRLKISKKKTTEAC